MTPQRSWRRSLGWSAAGVVAMANASTTQAIQNISNATQGLVSVVYLGALAGMFAFTRENESEADAFGLNVAREPDGFASVTFSALTPSAG